MLRDRMGGPKNKVEVPGIDDKVPFQRKSGWYLTFSNARYHPSSTTVTDLILIKERWRRAGQANLPRCGRGGPEGRVGADFGGLFQATRTLGYEKRAT